MKQLTISIFKTFSAPLSSTVLSLQILDCLQSQIYCSSELLFVPSMFSPRLLSTSATIWIWPHAGLFKRTSSQRSPLRKRVISQARFEQEISTSNPAVGAAMLLDRIWSGKQCTARREPEDSTFRLKRKVFTTILQYSGVVSSTLTLL